MICLSFKVSTTATSESPLDKAIAKIKKSMEDNGLSVFFICFQAIIILLLKEYLKM